MINKTFNFGQTFTVGSSVGNQIAAHVTGIDIYWMYKPPAASNLSATSNPGVTIYCVPTIYGVPQITTDALQYSARLEWANILTSSDGTVPSRFKFTVPVPVKPGQTYAFVASFDNNDTFWPWLSRSGKTIVGTNIPYNGSAAQGVGKYFESINLDGTSDPTADQTEAQYLSHWRPLDGTSVKFSVYCARYAIDGVPVLQANLTPQDRTNLHDSGIISIISTADGLTYSYPSQCIENIQFDVNRSTLQAFIGAQRVYQNTVFYPGGYANGSSSVSVSSNGSLVIVANTNLPNGQAFNWNTVFNNYTGTKFVTLFDTSVTNVRRVSSIINATALMFDEPTTFSNTNAKFMITPVASIDSFNTAQPGGVTTSFMFLNHSNANSSVRFVNNSIESITSNGGTAYTNSDVIYVTGYEYVANKVTGGYVAVGNIVTNSTGGIVNVYLSNTGAGFVNAAAIKIVVANSSFNPVGLTNATANSSVGNNAAFTITTGATINTELTNNIFKGCTVVNLDVHDITPYFNITAPSGTGYSINMSMLYFLTADPAVYGGYAYYVSPAAQTFDMNLNTKNFILGNQTPVFASFSNEYNLRYSNGAINDQVNPLAIYSKSFVLNCATTSNNDYVVMSVDSTPTVEFGKYIINNDYTNEHTNNGNAWAKHVTTIINFTTLSEDIRLYVDAYKPISTDIQAFARIQNSGDPQPFDDEDWTRLQLVDGTNIYSSSSKADDYVELTYGFQSAPNTLFTVVGSVTTTNASATVTFQGGNTANIVANTMVKLYSPLFAQNYTVATVSSVTNSSQIILNQSINSNTSTFGNPALVGSGLKMDVLQYPNQAFSNPLFDNTVRYFNDQGVAYDGYDILQIKLVMLSSSFLRIPRIKDVRATGVTA